MILFYLSIIDSEDDREWLAGVYKEHKQFMLNTAYYYIKNEEDAKDAVHEVFLRLCKNITAVPRDPIVLKIYLFTAIRNVCYTLIRKRTKHPVLSLDEQFATPSDTDVQNIIASKTLYEQVIEYIEKMPIIYCEVLTLYYVCKSKPADISKILKIPYKTAEVRLYRGKKLLKERFKDFTL